MRTIRNATINSRKSSFIYKDSKSQVWLPALLLFNFFTSIPHAQRRIRSILIHIIIIYLVCQSWLLNEHQQNS
ncbi:hypothetical protein KIN20_037166 [Parelaphostrongylus tenuis]|uniref:Uncharacterized protein n=1 Tax=Parelaphostrongylus tenuis TaxID=148309 RepID=A0AAD5RE74_PARTN|nr:hypothetical protein KIN20_037166 [Parelaphostrongylus tenuis]